MKNPPKDHNIPDVMRVNRLKRLLTVKAAVTGNLSFPYLKGKCSSIHDSLSLSLSPVIVVCVCCCSGACAVTAGHVRRGWMGKRSSSPGPTPASGRRRPGTWREEVPLRACLVSSRLCIYFCPSHIDVPPTCALSLCFFFFLLPFSLTSKLTHTFPPRVKHL